MLNAAMSEAKEICIVEDDPDIRDVLASLFEMEGYAVETAANGREALDLLHRKNTLPCVVLLDLMMPVMNGWEFIDEARRNYSNSSLPIVIMSAIAEQARPLASQVSGFVKKPTDISTLLNLVKKCAK
jgi:CheY-like chemotaxis protein